MRVHAVWRKRSSLRNKKSAALSLTHSLTLLSPMVELMLRSLSNRPSQKPKHKKAFSTPPWAFEARKVKERERERKCNMCERLEEEVEEGYDPKCVRMDHFRTEAVRVKKLVICLVMQLVVLWPAH